MPPEEIRVNAPGPNGNGFSLDLREKKLGLTGPNVALLLLIILIGAVAYLRTGTIDKTMKAGQEQIAGTEDRVHKRVDQLFLRIDKLIDDMQAQNLLLNANNAKVTTGQHELRVHLDEGMLRQNDLLHTKIGAFEKYIETWFSEVGKRMEILDFNIKHPDRALPLRGFQPGDDRQQERGR